MALPQYFKFESKRMLTKPTKKDKLLFLHFSFCMDCVFVIGMLNSETLEAHFIFVLNYVQRL